VEGIGEVREQVHHISTTSSVRQYFEQPIQRTLRERDGEHRATTR